MTTAAPTTADAFVARLLATDDAGKRRALIERADLDPAGFHDAVLALVAEAERVMGADPRRMERVCLDALALAERGDDGYLRAMARMRYGDYFRIVGRNAEARDHYDEAAAAFTALNRPVEAARTRIGWVWATARLGKPEEAMAAARAAQRVLINYGETFRAATLQESIGLLYYEHGRYRSALRAQMRAIATYRSVDGGAWLQVARSRANAAMTLMRLGRYAEALREFEVAHDSYSAPGDTVGTARVLRSMGEAQMELGQYAAALRALEEAQGVFRGQQIHGETAQVAQVLADCYLYLNRPADALAALQEADHDLSYADGVQLAFGMAVRRVAAHLLRGERGQALSVLAEVEAGLKPAPINHQAWLAEQRAAIILRDGDASEAVNLARRAGGLARVAGQRRREAAALLIEGTALLALGEREASTRVARRAGRVARAVDAAPLLARSQELLGRLAETEDRTTAARRHYTRAIEQLEREQRGVIFEFRDSFAFDRSIPYERLATLQLQAGRHLDAFLTAERAKSRALADAIAGAVQIQPRGSAEARRLARELDRARGEYAAAATEAARRQYDSSPQQDEPPHDLAAIEQRVADLVRQLQLAGADDISSVSPRQSPPELPTDTALIEYFISGDDILRFHVDHAGVRGEVLAGARPDVERLFHAFRLNRDLAGQTSPDSPRHEALVAQAKTVMARLESRLLDGLPLAAYRSLVIVPHGVLHYLPFHAFFDGSRYLVERATVSYAPSAALYAVCRARAGRPRPRGALVLAHSADGRLPHVLGEATAVGKVLRAPVHREQAATRALLERRGQRAGLIHIAAHGEFRPDTPLFSFVKLADGPITTADVFNLHLSCRLVTLSACETGRTVIGGGDELAGLTRAFLYAGTAGLLVSQWRVDDASTAALMTRFYQALSTGARAADAIRTAQMDCLTGAMPQTSSVHPFYWAGFQLIGDC